MPYKDEYGIWRHDKPQLVGCEPVSARSHGHIRKSYPRTCPVCGAPLEVDDTIADDEFNEELAVEWGYDDLPTYQERDDFAMLFTFMKDFVCCTDSECTFYFVSREYYYNPKINNYDLPRPLTRDEAKYAEIEAERLASESAGQMRLFEL